MDDKKKRFSPRHEGDRKEGGGQRISVRPGNFTPPGTPVTPIEQQPRRNNDQQGRQDRRNNQGNAQQGGRREGNQPATSERQTTQKGAEQRREGEGNGHNRNRRNRNRRNRNNRGRQEERNTQVVQEARNTPAESAPVTPATPPLRRDERPNKGERQNRGERRDERRPQKGDRQKATQPRADLLSPSLARELEEEFSTPAFAPFTAKKAATETAVDTDEFAVDIATAAYLVEDIPCGFPVPDGKAVEVVGVRFRNAGKIYFFEPNKMSFRIGESVLVDTARGEEIGEIVMLNRKIAEKNIIQPLRQVLRRATKEDIAHEQENRQKEREALKICAEKIAEHQLDMKLIDAQYTFDNSKLLFYFTSEGRVDFRDLVRDLAGIFRTRIELRQIGIRDESRLIGGLGMCGRPFCCTTFLSDFGQVSIKMAKEQGLSINASKISGCCGRLMCCLRYEHETYAAEARLTPKKDAPVETPEGKGVVVEATPLAGTVKVRLENAPEEPPRVFHRDQVTVISREKPVATETVTTDDTTENSEK